MSHDTSRDPNRGAPLDHGVESGAAPRSRTRPRAPLIGDVAAARWLLLALLAASIYFFHGFIVPVLAATVIVVASWPVRQNAIHQIGMGRTIASTLLVLVLVCFIVIPLFIAFSYAFHELRIWGAWLFTINGTGAPTPEWLTKLPQVGQWIDEKWTTTIGKPGGIGQLVQFVSGENIGSIYRGALTAGSMAFHIFLNLVFMLVAMFVFYRDGDRIVSQIDRVGLRILPGRWERLSRVAPATISSTVTGMVIIAIGEGVILGVAYWIAGVPSPVTLAVITGFMALIPGGAPLSFTLVSLYLVASGSTFAGVALFVWGSVELFIVDKTIRPLLVGGPVRLPFLPTFFGLIGGVKTMGIVGLFVGPVLMALLMSIWREWQREIAEDEQRGIYVPPTSRTAAAPPPAP